MARKARQRISYVLPLANSPGGHRLGVNGLAVDSDRSILYSGGRDGLICAWDLKFQFHDSSQAETDLPSPPLPASNPPPEAAKASTFRKQVQAHTHWVNDIILTRDNTALVSASSDITVKVWRPDAEDHQNPTTIGLHSDYVKCLASPGTHSDWVASGGLDHKICVWDLNGGGEKLHIDVGQDENSAKGSVYALSVRGSVMASGGPESIVRLWDPKSGKRITSFVGHTDNVRDILINQDADKVMTASSDQTVKLWSMTAGRCMYTLTMHNDSVWSLHSDHPQLSIFYSGDRSGLVARTDVRGCKDMNDGLSLAIAQEHEGINELVVAGDWVWTATSSSSISRWKDVDTTGEIEFQEPARYNQNSIASPPKSTPPPHTPPLKTAHNIENMRVPLSCVLRISNNAIFPGQASGDAEAVTIYSANIRKPSETVLEHNLGVVVAFHELPEETIEGQNGLIKHVMLNDRKRVLTLDTAGEVMMWDLLKCIPIQSFGKRHLEDVTPEVNTTESVANWCGVDTRTGRLACVLEENYCFDAEMYMDELGTDNSEEFKDDQRVNFGKWILRYLFANLIDVEIHRDAIVRQNMISSMQTSSGLRRDNAPPLIQLPSSTMQGWNAETLDEDSLITPRPVNGNVVSTMTPGLSIGVATPYVGSTNFSSPLQNHLSRTSEEGSDLDKRLSGQSQPRNSTEKQPDYFSSIPNPQSPSDTQTKAPSTPGDGSSEATSQIVVDDERKRVDDERKEKPKNISSLFDKKFRMNFPKKLGRTSAEAKPTAVDEKAEESDMSEEKEEKTFEENFFGTIQKVRHDYEEHIRIKPFDPLPPGLRPSLPHETPVLSLPPSTTIIIQEDRPDSGGVADLYRGTVSSVGLDVDLIERAGPRWLGDLLLQNQLPPKEIQKVSFVLLPYQDLLPSIAGADGNSRLNANRMLRAKKICAYVADRIEPKVEENYAANVMSPDEYIELYCQNQLVPKTMTLATLRAYVWKNGGDVILYYKSNGRKASVEKLINKNSGDLPKLNGMPAMTT